MEPRLQKEGVPFVRGLTESILLVAPFGIQDVPHALSGPDDPIVLSKSPYELDGCRQDAAVAGVQWDAQGREPAHVEELGVPE
jgi:hypothetical protein